MNTTQPRWTRIGLYTIAVMAVWTALAVWGEATFASGAWRPVEPAIALAFGASIDAVQRRRVARAGSAA